jgi:hypothetical protein
VKCPRCDDTYWVCEAHDDRPWGQRSDVAVVHMRRARPSEDVTGIHGYSGRQRELSENAASRGGANASYHFASCFAGDVRFKFRIYFI